ncbi:MAG: hypothetical protein LBG12_05850, partial [Synergistaceae bacterium]|nr:hypothetical protein [Synergistaceae bacterium]
FRKDFLLSKDLRFDERFSFGEDCDFSARALVMSEKAAFSPRCLYVYVQHEGMSTRASRATKEKHFKCRMDATLAHLNAAHYMAEHVRSPKILKAVRHLLLPEYHLKMFKLYAWLGDYETFRKELGSPGMRRMLWSSWKVFFKEPQIFLKAFFLLAFPKLTFEVRRRTSRFK